MVQPFDKKVKNDYIIYCRFNGSRAILSGPAGGVVGYAMTSYEKETGQPVIGFDMGGEDFKVVLM